MYTDGTIILALQKDFLIAVKVFLTFFSSSARLIFGRWTRLVQLEELQLPRVC